MTKAVTLLASDPGAEARRLRCDASATLTAGLGLTVLASLWIAAQGGFDGAFAPASLATYCIIAGIAATGLAAHPHARFGSPNAVTTLRAVMTSLMTGLVFEIERLGESALDHWTWGFTILAAVSTGLDGLDGHLARRLRLASPFGARYDMEVDALLILVLSIAVFQLGKADASILIVGLMRYVFVAAGWLLPRLRDELPFSRRRRAICAVQSVALCLMMAPVLPPDLSRALGLATLALMSYSFLVDIIWLARPRPGPA